MIVVRGKVLNVFTGNIEKGEVVIEKDRVSCIGKNLKADETYDFSEYFILPGFIDAHIHIESSMVSPSHFARTVLPHGTTAVVTDPHEIANVSGIEGIDFMLKDSEASPMKLFFTAPSCVPSTNFETSGSVMNVDDIRKLLQRPSCVGLGEVMNFPGVVSGDPQLLSKIKAAKDAGKIVDGHSPGLTGPNLCKYVKAGTQSDHECTQSDEASEKMKLGMRIMIREGSVMKNMNSLINIVNIRTEPNCMLVSDDLHPGDMLKEGHIDRLLKKAVALGADPASAVRMVTINPARYFNLKDIGAIAPGYIADMVVVKDMRDFEVLAVFADGKLVAKDGKPLFETNPFPPTEKIKSSVKVQPFGPVSFKVSAEKKSKVRVIDVPNGKTEAELECRLGQLQPDIENDILPLVVVERHKRTGNIGKTFVKGFCLRGGALASTVAHDSHNIICVGANYVDMAYAVNTLEKMGGGMVVVKDNHIVESLELPIAGLMSRETVEHVDDKMKTLNSAAQNLGCKLVAPFMEMSFLALPVIPKLKLTDKGLVDVEKFEFVNPIIADSENQA